METHKYSQIVNACKCEFAKRHGVNHNKYPWSSKVYDVLVHEYLQYDRFVLEPYGGIKWTHPYGSTHVYLCIDNSLTEFIVYCADLDTLKRIYERVYLSKNNNVKKRVQRLHDALGCIHYDKNKIEYDLDFMTLFLECILKPVKNTDYSQYAEQIVNHVKSAKRRDKNMVGWNRNFCLN